MSYAVDLIEHLALDIGQTGVPALNSLFCLQVDKNQKDIHRNRAQKKYDNILLYCSCLSLAFSLWI